MADRKCNFKYQDLLNSGSDSYYCALCCDVMRCSKDSDECYSEPKQCDGEENCILWQTWDWVQDL